MTDKQREILSLFDIGKEHFHIGNRPVYLIELFAGIGSQAKALKNIGVNIIHHKICEFDKYAVQSYNAVHGTDFETSDITQLKASDLEITDTKNKYSFPCTDLSVAGLQKGMEEGSGTRSSLLWEVKRLLKECDELPQILLMENVPQVHGKKNLESFNKFLNFLESLGYKNYWKDLNAKDYGIAQNRNRTFVVSILGDYLYDFPEPVGLTKKVYEYIEPDVDEKHFVSKKGADYILRRLGKYTQIITADTEIAKSAITAKGNANWTGNFVLEREVCIKDYLDEDVDEKYYITSEKARDLINRLVEEGKLHGEEKHGVDLSYSQAKIVDENVSCIKARYDAGINLPKMKEQELYNQKG